MSTFDDIAKLIDSGYSAAEALRKVSGGSFVFSGEGQIDFVSGKNTYLYFQSTSNYVGRSASGDVILNAAGSQATSLAVNGSNKIKVDDTSSAGDTALFLWDVDNATLERVTVGAADSGGAGYKVLRIPN